MTIVESNLDTTKSSLLLMASMPTLDRLPRAKDPRNPALADREAALAKVAEFQEFLATNQGKMENRAKRPH